MSSSGGRALSQEEHSDDSEARRPSTGETKRRPSRAGTRSVNTLSAAQLERKRANDREAQRAIRQRTKEHIDKLEKRVAELSINEEIKQQLTAALRRNEELEQENAVLRTKLDHASVALAVAESRNPKVEQTTFPTGPASPSNTGQIIGQQRQGSMGAIGSGNAPFLPSRLSPLGGGRRWQQHEAYPTAAMSPIGSPPSASRDMRHHGLPWTEEGSHEQQTSVHDQPQQGEEVVPASMNYGYVFNQQGSQGHQFPYRVDRQQLLAAQSRGIQIRRTSSQPQVPQLAMSPGQYYLHSSSEQGLSATVQQMSPPHAMTHQPILPSSMQPPAGPQMQSHQGGHQSPHSALENQQYYYNLPPNQ